MSDVPCPKCNRHPGRGPVGVALDGNGRTTTCRNCNGRGWLEPCRLHEWRVAPNGEMQCCRCGVVAPDEEAKDAA